MALNLQGYSLREAVGLAERGFNLIGAPVWDEDAWGDLSALGAAWPASDSYPNHSRNCRVPTEAEINSAVQTEINRIQSEAVRLAADIASKTTARNLASAWAQFQTTLDAIASGADELAAVDYSGLGTVAAVRNAVQADMRRVGQGMKALVAQTRNLADATRFSIVRELRR